MSIQLDLIEPYVTGYSRVTLDIAAAVRTASAIKINNYIYFEVLQRNVPPWWLINDFHIISLSIIMLYNDTASE